MTEMLTIRGRKFALTICPQPDRPRPDCKVAWQWILAAPGQLVLSGEAASADHAERSARRAGRALVRIGKE
jgi:hypothetical protein